MTIAAARIAAGVALALAIGSAPVALAQERDERPLRWRVGIGPQLVPSYPGADRVSLRPFIDVSRARGNDPFAFEAPDESAGFPLFASDGLSIGPAIGFEGRRRGEVLGADLTDIGFTVEAGGFVQYQLGEQVRLRGEVRKGLGGHAGWIGNLGADYVMRDADRWLMAIGPRVTLTDARYQRAYFGVGTADAARTGIAAHDPGGGIQAVGVNIGYLRQLDARWGISSYAKYDRLVDGAAASPLVRTFGARDQWSGGIALSYSFGG